MSERNIYRALRAGGLSPAGACGVMGNMYCESLLKSNIVEKRCSLSDEDYTYNVDNGIFSMQQFIHDAYGYGLAQWTFYTRKQELYTLAKSKGVSIGDEAMQCELCLRELQRDYRELYNYLCVAEDLFTAASRVCKEFEKPAVENVFPRYDAAQRYYNNRFEYGEGEEDFAPGDDPADEGDTNPQPPAYTGETAEISVRVLQRGMKGRDVYLLQCGINDVNPDYASNCGRPDGDFGYGTEGGVRNYQGMCNLPVTGIVDKDTWQTLFQ